MSSEALACLELSFVQDNPATVTATVRLVGVLPSVVQAEDSVLTKTIHEFARSKRS